MGFDPAKLDEIAAEAEAAHSNCLLITRKGKIVGEWYWNGTSASTSQEVFSATKSYASTLVGIAQAEGKLDIDDKASKYIPEWVGTPSDDVTVKHLISNNSGRHWDAATDYVTMAVREPDKTAFSIGLSQDAPPGSTWAYNNSAIQTLDEVLQKATGQSPSDYAESKLLAPIGMTNSEMKKDPSGNTLTFMGLSSTCQDMARFGYLFLRDGNWNGTQVVPSEWVEEATGRSSQELNAAYGYLWWLNRRGNIADPARPTTGRDGGDEKDSQMRPGAPEDMFFALGLGDQIISIDPGSETVVARLGPVNVPKDAPGFGTGDAVKVVTEALTQP
jgi:CubicO group peptidase (beta-lactamase class C family)